MSSSITGTSFLGADPSIGVAVLKRSLASSIYDSSKANRRETESSSNTRSNHLFSNIDEDEMLDF